jgi:hypothetical protein
MIGGTISPALSLNLTTFKIATPAANLLMGATTITRQSFAKTANGFEAHPHRL